MDAQHLHDLLLELGRRNPLRDPVAAACQQLDLTPPQVHVLLWLGSDGPLPMNLLAQRARTNQRTITGVVDRLERDGYVERVRHPTDRRVIQVHLTSKGARTFQKLDGQLVDGLAQIMAVLTVNQRKQLFDIIQRLVDKAPALRSTGARAISSRSR